MRTFTLHLAVFCFIAFAGGGSYATDCNSNCEDHFDKWYQEPDLGRCKIERRAACQWGIEHCDFHPQEFSVIRALIQDAHDILGKPRDVHQCYRYIDKGALAHAIGEKGYQIYQLAEGVSSKFNPYAIAGKEMAKQILRCACKNIRWSDRGSAESGGSTPPRSSGTRTRGGERPVCIQNAHNGKYLSDVISTLYDRCSTGEKWRLIRSGEAYCIQNAHNGKYLSDVITTLYDRCSTGEKWRLIRSGEAYCIQNAHNGKYLSDVITTLYDRCSTGEKWILQ